VASPSIVREVGNGCRISGFRLLELLLLAIGSNLVGNADLPSSLNRRWTQLSLELQAHGRYDSGSAGLQGGLIREF
jgi:hypothetical protein